jgi:hypothetical protein
MTSPLHGGGQEFESPRAHIFFRHLPLTPVRHVFRSRYTIEKPGLIANVMALGSVSYPQFRSINADLMVRQREVISAPHIDPGDDMTGPPDCCLRFSILPSKQTGEAPSSFCRDLSSALTNFHGIFARLRQKQISSGHRHHCRRALVFGPVDPGHAGDFCYSHASDYSSLS